MNCKMANHHIGTGHVLVKGDGSDQFDAKDTTKYCSRIALYLYKMQWLRPDIYNATCNCARHMSAPRLPHKKALQH